MSCQTSLLDLHISPFLADLVSTPDNDISILWMKTPVLTQKRPVVTVPQLYLTQNHLSIVAREASFQTQAQRDYLTQLH